MTYEQMVGLEPFPDGTVIELFDPYKKTVRFELHTDNGIAPCAPPIGYVPRPGYTVESSKA